MFNAHRPSLDELPTTRQLVRSTITAAIIALVILLTVVLPAEYAIDPLGIGRVLGLTEMGEVKQALAEEARQQDAAKAALAQQPSEEPVVAPAEKVNEIIPVVDVTATDTVNSESMTVTIAPNATAEIKAKMSKGDKVEYSWSTQGGPLNYNVHGEPTRSSDGPSYEYDKGLNATDKSGSITAVYDGTHGWYWRNRSDQDITLTITVDGEFVSLIEI